MHVGLLIKGLVATVVLATLVSFCPPAGKQELLDLVKKNSRHTPVSFLQLENYIDFSKLKPLDSELLKPLMKFEAYNNRGCSGCPVSLYYYSYFEYSKELTAVIFAKLNSGDDGTAHQLVIAFIDKKGSMTDAFIAAEMVNYAECNYSITTTIKKTDFVITNKEDCVILPGNKHEGVKQY